MEEDKIVIYQTEDGQTQIDVRLENDMIWLTRQQLAVLFDRDYKTISKHINNALKEELADTVVVAKYANTTQHGAIEGKKQTHEKEYFNLGAVEIKEQYMRMYGFDYKKACCSINDFEFEKLDKKYIYLRLS